MEKYKNLSGNSGVTAYENGPSSIIVQFKDNSKYLYNYTKPGSQHTENMKNLAVAGRGLNTYINTHVKYDYASKLS